MHRHMSLIKSKKRAAGHAEVFPAWMVEAMLLCRGTTFVSRGVS